MPEMFDIEKGRIISAAEVSRPIGWHGMLNNEAVR